MSDKTSVWLYTEDHHLSPIVHNHVVITNNIFVKTNYNLNILSEDERSPDSPGA